MVVDNDPQAARLAALIISRCGYPCEVVTGGREAIIRIQRRPDDYSCVLTDYGMTPVSGTDVGAAIKTASRAQHIRMILASGDRDIAEIARRHHFDDYLGKPYEFDDLIRLLNKHVGAPSPSMYCYTCQSVVSNSSYDAALLEAHIRQCIRPRMDVDDDPIREEEAHVPVTDVTDPEYANDFIVVDDRVVTAVIVLALVFAVVWLLVR